MEEARVDELGSALPPRGISTTSEAIQLADRIIRLTLINQEMHTAAAEEWRFRRNVLGLPIALLSAITGAAAFSQIPNHAEITGILALAVAVLTAMRTFWNPDENAELNRTSMRSFEALRFEADRFKAFYAKRKEDEVIRSVELLYNKYNELKKQSPETSQKQRDQALSKWSARFGVDETKLGFRDLGVSSDLPQAESPLGVSHNGASNG